MDLIVSRDEITNIVLITSYASMCLDHFLIAFESPLHVDRRNRPRRITKTLLQSHSKEETANIYYEVGLRQVESHLDQVGQAEGISDQDDIKEVFKEMEQTIKLPWANQANKRRRHTPAHRNHRFLKLLARKKLLYDRKKWRSNRANSRAYKDVCAEAQRYERQLARERQRRNIQRIQNDPEFDIALAIRNQATKRKRQAALDKLSGTQMSPREYALYMRYKLDQPGVEDVQIEHFEVNLVETSKQIQRAISVMEKNKAAGGDQVHV